jgi:hypothetical protein
LAKQTDGTLMVMQGLVSFVLVGMLLAGVLTIALFKEPKSGDAFIEDFTMQPDPTSCFSRLG